MQSERNLIRSSLGEAAVRRIIALSAIAVLLAACQPEAPGGGEALPPADAPSAPSTPAAPSPPAEAQDVAFSASGTEPFWRIDIKNDQITLTRPDAPAATATSAALTIGTGMSWTATAGSSAVTVKLTKGECSDGMSDLKYPYVAEVTWGAETLKGCGFPTAEQPHEGE